MNRCIYNLKTNYKTNTLNEKFSHFYLYIFQYIHHIGGNGDFVIRRSTVYNKYNENFPLLENVNQLTRNCEIDMIANTKLKLLENI